MDKIIFNKGFLTLEVMMAMTILMIVLSGVVVVSFGNQNTLIDSQTNSEAINKAQALIESEQALARKDFNLVNATSTYDGFYTGVVTVTNPIDTATGKPDYFTKSVKAVVSWNDEHNIARSTDVTTLVTNFGNTAGGNTCNSSPVGNWYAPTKHTYTLTSLAGITGNYPITDIDAYRDKLYVAAGPTAGTTDKTLFVFTLTNGVPAYVAGSSIDTSGNTTKGASAVVAVSTTTAAGGKIYAFVANGVAPDWSSPSTCAIASASCSQLQVVDVTNASAPVLVINVKFATSTFSTPNTPPYITGTGGQATGKSILYKNGYLFLGLTKTLSGPEFIIIDVHNPLLPQTIGSFAVGRSVESIAVSGNYAYLATDDNASNNILTILDISDPTHPAQIWPSVIPTGIGFGRNLAVVGDTLYFVKSADSSKPEWYILDNPTPGTMAPTTLATLDLGNGTSINNILVRDYLAFLTTSPAGTLLIRSATSTAQYAPPISLPAAGTALDCEGNYLYVGSSDAAGTITVVTGS